MQQIIGIFFISFGMLYFFFAKRNLSVKSFKDYNIINVIRRFKVSIYSIILGVILYFELISW